jgi:hypothetical protein
MQRMPECTVASTQKLASNEAAVQRILFLRSIESFWTSRIYAGDKSNLSSNRCPRHAMVAGAGLAKGVHGTRMARSGLVIQRLNAIL